MHSCNIRNEIRMWSVCVFGVCSVVIVIWICRDKSNICNQCFLLCFWWISSELNRSLHTEHSYVTFLGSGFLFWYGDITNTYCCCGCCSGGGWLACTRRCRFCRIFGFHGCDSCGGGGWLGCMVVFSCCVSTFGTLYKGFHVWVFVLQ